FVAKDDHARGAGYGGSVLAGVRLRRRRFAVGFGEVASEGDGGAEGPEGVGGGDGEGDLLGRVVVARDGAPPRAHGRAVPPGGFGSVAEVDVARVGEGELLHVAASHFGDDKDKARWLLVGEWAQEDGVGDREDGGGGSESESDGEDRGEGEERGAAEGTYGVD